MNALFSFIFLAGIYNILVTIFIWLGQSYTLPDKILCKQLGYLDLIMYIHFISIHIGYIHIGRVHFLHFPPILQDLLWRVPRRHFTCWHDALFCPLPVWRLLRRPGYWVPETAGSLDLQPPVPADTWAIWASISSAWGKSLKCGKLPDGCPSQTCILPSCHPVTARVC